MADPVKSSPVLSRVLAKSVDLLLVFTLALLLPYPLGPLLGFLYSLLADGISWKTFHGQSLGKKLLKLQVVQQHSRQPIHYKDSMIRNAPVGVATFFAMIPVWGWLFLGIFGIPLLIMEVYLMLTVQTGHRLGDVMGDTEVIAHS